MIFYNLQEALQYLNAFDDITIGVTSGCFDLIHPLHVLYLNKCKRECQILIVQVDSDMLTFKNKNKIPHINELDRSYMIDNVKSVDCTLVINQIEDITLLLEGLDKTKNHIKIFKHSGAIYGNKAIEVEGAQLVIIADVNRFNSTTEIRNYLKEKE